MILVKKKKCVQSLGLSYPNNFVDHKKILAVDISMITGKVCVWNVCAHGITYKHPHRTLGN